jgi:lysozyme
VPAGRKAGCQLRYRGPARCRDAAAAIQSELTTFLNQIENHTGKPAILKLSRRFEQRYHISAAIDRNLWLVRTRFQPDYAGRPWTLWTANQALANAVSDAPLHWVAVQP